MTQRQPRPAWWIVVFGLVITLSVNWVLPAFDHHAVEYSPFHGHLVLGAGSAGERDHALAAHAHGAGQPHTHREAAPAAHDSSDEPTTVVGTALLNELQALADSVVHVIVSGAWRAPTPALALWLMLLPAALLLLGRMTPPPEQPPRSY